MRKKLNLYYKDIREKVGPRLNAYPEVKDYMNKITEPFKYSHMIADCKNYINGSGLSAKPTQTVTLLAFFISCLLSYAL